jgi:DNA-binding MurR/RpiR family transcriptional regulator
MTPNSVEPQSCSIRERIQSVQTGFTKADQRIAGVVLADYPLAGLQTLVDLGKATGSSPATVLRFVGKLGFSCYPEFQKVLREELQSTLDSPLSRYQSGEALGQSGEPLAQYAGYARQLIDETVSMVPKQELEAVVALLSDVRRPVYLIGGRYSRSLAELFGYSLSSMRSGVRIVRDDQRMMVEALSEIGKRDIIIAFDFRRYQENVQQFVVQAAEAGGRVVLFTDRWRSPSAQHANHVLSLPVASPSVFDTGLSALLLIEAIVASLAERPDINGEKHIARVELLYRRLGSGLPKSVK